jgi:hypothetical protein
MHKNPKNNVHTAKANRRRRIGLTIAAIALPLGSVLASGVAKALPCRTCGGGDGGTGGSTTTQRWVNVGHGTRTVFEVDQSDDKVDNNNQWTIPLVVAPGDRADIAASGYVIDGWWFHGQDGPNGWVGNIAGNDYPLPGANTGELLARFGSGGYQVVGAGRSLYNTTGVPQTLYLKRNDNVPGNGSGWFDVVVNTYHLQ